MAFHSNQKKKELINVLFSQISVARPSDLRSPSPCIGLRSHPVYSAKEQRGFSRRQSRVEILQVRRAKLSLGRSKAAIWLVYRGSQRKNGRWSSTRTTKKYRAIRLFVVSRIDATLCFTGRRHRPRDPLRPGRHRFMSASNAFFRGAFRQGATIG